VAKEKGNAAYKAGKLDRAARMYTRVTDLVGDKDAAADKDKEGGPEVRAQVRRKPGGSWRLRVLTAVWGAVWPSCCGGCATAVSITDAAWWFCGCPRRPQRHQQRPAI
jgi:hypothetical protein